jgi:class 3 adenylate cyclase/tetratricopeptide (TPR) repeat protein
VLRATPNNPEDKERRSIAGETPHLPGIQGRKRTAGIANGLTANPNQAIEKTDGRELAVQCPDCAATNPASRTFCGECAGSLGEDCPRCGFLNTARGAFCGGCGTHIRPESARVNVDSRIQPPRRLLDRILRTRSAIEGERKQVTVLFADIVGSTALIEGVDPESAALLLQPALDAMKNAVHHFDGTVNRVHGDGIMALFGAPLAHEQHAVNACCAALEMPAAVRQASSDLLSIRVGLHSGEVVVRSIGNDMSMNYDAIGETVHIASRMEQFAAPNSVCATADTMHRAEGFVDARCLGERSIKSLTQPVVIYELKGRPTAHSTWQVRAKRGLTPFLGRQSELASLRRALELARTGRGQVVTVQGDPGVGKSRLVHEFLRLIEVSDVSILEAEALLHRRNAAYFPVIALLRAWIAAADADSKQQIDEKLIKMADAVHPEIERILTPLRSLLDIPCERTWKSLEAAQRRQQTLYAIVELISAAAHSRPLVLLVEDLQWVDSETHAVIARLASALTELPILLVLTHRPNCNEELSRTVPTIGIRLEPLERPIANDLLRVLLGDDSSLEQLGRRIIEQASGFPLFLEETVRTLREMGVLSGERGSYRLAVDIDSIEIPSTIQDVLAARIDCLRPETKGLLQVAAAIGTPLPVALLCAVTGVLEEEIDGLLVELQEADFLYQLAPLHRREYDFKHALTRDVAYGGMLRTERQRLHAAILAEIETLYADRLDEQVDRLADHAYCAGRWVEAVQYSLRACIRAISRSAMREGLAIFERGLDALTRLPTDDESRNAGIDLRLIAGNALVPLGEQDALVCRLREAEQIAEALGEPRRLGLVYSQLTTALWLTADYGRGLDTGQRALDVAVRLENQPLELAARFGLGMQHHGLGNHREAISIHKELLAGLPPEFERERLGWAGYPSLLIRTFLVDSLIDLGDFDEAQAISEEGIALADQIGHTYSRAMITHVLGRLLTEMGRGDEAVSILEPMLTTCREEEIWTMVPPTAAWLGLAYTHTGQHELAARTLQQTLRPEIRRYGARCTWLYLYIAAGTTYLNSRQPELAFEMAREAESLTARNQELGYRARALMLMGDAITARGGEQTGQAKEWYSEALSLAADRGMRPVVARVHLSLGELYAGDHRWEEAERELSLALQGFEELELHEPFSRAAESLQRIRQSQVK